MIFTRVLLMAPCSDAGRCWPITIELPRQRMSGGAAPENGPAMTTTITNPASDSAERH